MDDDIGRDKCLGKCQVNLEKFKPTSTPKATDVVVDKNIFKRDAIIYLKIAYT